MFDRVTLVLVVWCILAFSCGTNKDLKPGEGFINVTGGKVWYRIVGEGDAVPLLLLHGGPGFPSYYLNPMGAMSADRPVIFIDQLGCGRSDSLSDTSFLTVENFVDQLEQIRAGLGLDEFYLYGHSWGTMLGTDYYLAHPAHVRAMILASPCLSTSMWMQDAEELIATLPDSIQAAIRTHDAQGTYDSPEYQQAMFVFYENFVARKIPWDANLDSTFTHFSPLVYNHMWGPSEFKASGILKNYDRTQSLQEIKVPVLYVCGEYDEARPSTVEYYQSLTPGARLAVIEDAAHATMHDNPTANNKAIADFLREVEKK